MKRPYPYSGQAGQSPATSSLPAAPTSASAYSNYGYGGAGGPAVPAYSQPAAVAAPTSVQPSSSHEAQQRQWHQQWQEYYAKQAAQAGAPTAAQPQAQPQHAPPVQQQQQHPPYGAYPPAQGPAPVHQTVHQPQQPLNLGGQLQYTQQPGSIPHAYQNQAAPQPSPAQLQHTALPPAWNNLPPQPQQQQQQQQPPPPAHQPQQPYYAQASQNHYQQAGASAPPAKRPRFETPSAYNSPQAQPFQHPLPAAPHISGPGRPHSPAQPIYGSGPPAQNQPPAQQNPFGWNSPSAHRGPNLPPQPQNFRGGRGGARGGLSGAAAPLQVQQALPIMPIQNPNAGNPLLAGITHTPPAARVGRGGFAAPRGGSLGGRGGSHSADHDRGARGGRGGRTGFGTPSRNASSNSTTPNGRGPNAQGRNARSTASTSSQSAAFEQAHRSHATLSAMNARLALGLDEPNVLNGKHKKQHFADFSFSSLEIAELGWVWTPGTEAVKSDNVKDEETISDAMEDGDNTPAEVKRSTAVSSANPGRLRITFAAAPSNTGPPGAPLGPSADNTKKMANVSKSESSSETGKAAQSEAPPDVVDWSPFSKGQHQPSNNRISLLYGPPHLQRRLAIDAETIKAVRIFREEARWEIEVRVQTQPRVQPPEKDGKKSREWVVARGVTMESREGDDNFAVVTRPQLEKAWKEKTNIVSSSEIPEENDKSPNGHAGKPTAVVADQAIDGMDPDVVPSLEKDDLKSDGGGEVVPASVDVNATLVESSEPRVPSEPPIPGLYSDLPPLHQLLEGSDSKNGGAQRTLIVSVSLASLQSEEPAWLRTGLIDEWLSKLPGYRRFPETQPWASKIRIMDPNARPTIDDVFTEWAMVSTVGYGRDRRNFVKDHFHTSRELAELLAKLCIWKGEKGTADTSGKGAATGSLVGALPTVQSFKDLGVPLNLPVLCQPSSFAAAEGDLPSAGKMSHLSFAALSLFGFANQYAEQAGVEDEVLRNQMALLLMIMPETALHRATDAIYRDYLAAHPAPKKASETPFPLSGVNAVGAACLSSTRRGSVASSTATSVAGGDAAGTPSTKVDEAYDANAKEVDAEVSSTLVAEDSKEQEVTEGDVMMEGTTQAPEEDDAISTEAMGAQGQERCETVEGATGDASDEKQAVDEMAVAPSATEVHLAGGETVERDGEEAQDRIMTDRTGAVGDVVTSAAEPYNDEAMTTVPELPVGQVFDFEANDLGDDLEDAEGEDEDQ